MQSLCSTSAAALLHDPSPTNACGLAVHVGRAPPVCMHAGRPGPCEFGLTLKCVYHNDCLWCSAHQDLILKSVCSVACCKHVLWPWAVLWLQVDVHSVRVCCRDVPYPVQAFTFGSPRTGNKAWAEAYDKVVPATFRFHNTNDAVAQVPWFLGYQHVNNQSRLDSFVDDSGAENGLLYMPRDNPISVFGGDPISNEVCRHSLFSGNSLQRIACGGRFACSCSIFTAAKHEFRWNRPAFRISETVLEKKC